MGLSIGASSSETAWANTSCSRTAALAAKRKRYRNRQAGRPTRAPSRRGLSPSRRRTALRARLRLRSRTFLRGLILRARRTAPRTRSTAPAKSAAASQPSQRRPPATRRRKSRSARTPPATAQASAPSTHPRSANGSMFRSLNESAGRAGATWPCDLNAHGGRVRQRPLPGARHGLPVARKLLHLAVDARNAVFVEGRVPRCRERLHAALDDAATVRRAHEAVEPAHERLPIGALKLPRPLEAGVEEPLDPRGVFAEQRLHAHEVPDVGGLARSIPIHPDGAPRASGWTA